MENSRKVPLDRHDIIIDKVAASHDNNYVVAVTSNNMVRIFFSPLGTIPILRQQKDWVGGSRKWPVFLTFSTVFMLIRWVGSKKAKNMLTQYRDGPFLQMGRREWPGAFA